MVTIGRRKFVAATAALAMAPYAAAQPQRRPVIGFLNGAAYELSTHLVRAFHKGLAEMGYVEGRNVDFEYRSAEGKYDRLPGLVKELVQRKVDLIAATGTPTGLPAKAATSTIPIVFVTGSDPVQQGLVTSFSRPGGNITGPVLLYLQQAGVDRSVRESGTQNIPQHELALYLQDTWKPSPRWTVSYGLRWEAQVQPDPAHEGNGAHT